jgi:hypothetical protein
MAGGEAVSVKKLEFIGGGPFDREVMRWIRHVPIGNGQLPTD